MSAVYAFECPTEYKRFLIPPLLRDVIGSRAPTNGEPGD